MTTPLDRLKIGWRWRLLKLLGLNDVIVNLCKQQEEAENLVKQAYNHMHEADGLNQKTRMIVDDIRRVTTIDVDVALMPKQPNTIILTGRFKGRAYVNFYDVTPETFEGLISHMRDLKQWGQVRNLDAPPAFSAFFERYS